MTKPFSLRKLMNSFHALSMRERLLTIFAGGFAVLYVGQSIVGWAEEHLANTRQLALSRQGQLENIAAILRRYVGLRDRRDFLQTSYEQSQMSFEQVTNELDRIVREAIGNDNYEVKKPHPPSPFGIDYEKQEFSLSIKSLTIEQLVKLLYQIEHGGRPIFLSKVDINKAVSGTEFAASLEIYSISKATQRSGEGSAA